MPPRATKAKPVTVKGKQPLPVIDFIPPLLIPPKNTPDPVRINSSLYYDKSNGTLVSSDNVVNIKAINTYASNWSSFNFLSIPEVHGHPVFFVVGDKVIMTLKISLQLRQGEAIIEFKPPFAMMITGYHPISARILPNMTIQSRSISVGSDLLFYSLKGPGVYVRVDTCVNTQFAVCEATDLVINARFVATAEWACVLIEAGQSFSEESHILLKHIQRDFFTTRCCIIAGDGVNGKSDSASCQFNNAQKMHTPVGIFVPINLTNAGPRVITSLTMHRLVVVVIDYVVIVYNFRKQSARSSYVYFVDYMSANFFKTAPSSEITMETFCQIIRTSVPRKEYDTWLTPKPSACTHQYHLFATLGFCEIHWVADMLASINGNRFEDAKSQVIVYIRAVNAQTPVVGSYNYGSVFSSIKQLRPFEYQPMFAHRTSDIGLDKLNPRITASIDKLITDTIRMMRRPPNEFRREDLLPHPERVFNDLTMSEFMYITRHKLHSPSGTNQHSIEIPTDEAYEVFEFCNTRVHTYLFLRANGSIEIEDNHNILNFKTTLLQPHEIFAVFNEFLDHCCTCLQDSATRFIAFDVRGAIRNVLSSMSYVNDIDSKMHFTVNMLVPPPHYDDSSYYSCALAMHTTPEGDKVLMFNRSSTHDDSDVFILYINNIPVKLFDSNLGREMLSFDNFPEKLLEAKSVN